MNVIDHVIVCVPDLHENVLAFEREHQVSSVEGGRHPGHGTANRIVPLGDSYVELVAVVDVGEAESSQFGTWVGRSVASRGADGIAIRTEDLDDVCRRLDLRPIAMSRPTAGGEELRWRVAGLEQMVESGLPFFIEWGIAPDLHPGKIPVQHAGGDLRLGEVVVRGDVARLEEWLGPTSDLRLIPGEPYISYAVISR